MIDGPGGIFASAHFEQVFCRGVLSPLPGQRSVYLCEKRHDDFGYTCRHNAWFHMKGDYHLWLDDDDYLADPEALSRLDSVTAPWAVFPVLHYGKIHCNNPPGLYRTGGPQILVRRDIAQVPLPTHDPKLMKRHQRMETYALDGRFIEALKLSHPNYEFLDKIAPIVVVEKSNYGRPD